jgi:ribosomal protein S18 acetylase RimI-like enzyme
MTRVPNAPAGVARIRPLARRDLAGVVRIDAIHTGAAQRSYWTRLFREFLAPARGRQRVALAADVDGALAGFLLADVRAFEFGSEPCGWILEVGVDPRDTRQGVASALLAEAVRRLRAAGVTTVRTMVRRNNVPVLTFFRTNGFAGGPYVQLELVGEDAPAFGTR